MTSPSASESIKIYVSTPGYMPRKVAVNPKDPISCLSDGTPHSFFYMGQALSESMSFEFYGISQNERVISIGTDSLSESKKLFWQRASNSCAEFSQKVSRMVSAGVRAESARLNDVILFKAESKERSFKKICQNYFFVMAENDSQKSSTNLSYESLTKPSSEPMPDPWISTISA